MDSKTIAAATAAVFTYIKTGEEAAYYYATSPAVEEEFEVLPKTIRNERTNSFSAWANAGRLSQMQQNSMINMKIK